MKYQTQRKLYLGSFVAIGAITIATSLGMAIKYKSESSSQQYLLEHGFTQPEITGLKWTCAKGTLRNFEFKALDKNGNEVEGYVCATRLLLSDNITIEKTTPKAKLKM